MILRPYFVSGLASLCALCANAGVPQSPSSASQPQSTRPSSSSASKAKAAQDSSAYRNPEFGFRYKVILGWVDRTQDMQAEEAQPTDQPTGSATSHQGKVLLAVFERPPEVQNDALNPAVVIAEENAASYPGLKTAADYLGPLTQLVNARGFQAAGAPSEVTIDGRALVQCDFKRDDAKRPAFQSTLILLEKGSLVSFTFIAATQEEVEDLIERLRFQRAASAKPK